MNDGWMKEWNEWWMDRWTCFLWGSPPRSGSVSLSDHRSHSQTIDSYTEAAPGGSARGPPRVTLSHPVLPPEAQFLRSASGTAWRSISLPQAQAGCPETCSPVSIQEWTARCRVGTPHLQGHLRDPPLGAEGILELDGTRPRDTHFCPCVRRACCAVLGDLR